MGDAFCTTRAGIHADGLLKDERIYSIFDTQKLLGRSSEVLVDAHSGLAGIAFWMNGHLGLSLDKKDPAVARVKAAVDALYDDGRTIAMSNEELTAIANQALREESK